MPTSSQSGKASIKWVMSKLPEPKTAWAIYRQELRDITTQVDFPWDVTWPEAP